MADLRLPCHEGDPDDWFIGRDGKQYTDDPYLTDAEIDAVLAEVDVEGLSEEDAVAAQDKAIDRAEQDARTRGLQRRRHAKEACRDCLFRTRCLERAIGGGHEHGTWGGYYQEEIREIRTEIARRKRRRR